MPQATEDYHQTTVSVVTFIEYLLSWPKGSFAFFLEDGSSSI